MAVRCLNGRDGRTGYLYFLNMCVDREVGGRYSRIGDRYSGPMNSGDDWSVERQLAGKPEHVVELYGRFVELIANCGPFTYRVTKSAIGFKGTHRGFAGAKPRGSSLDGFLDLQRAVDDERFLRVSPYTQKLFVHQFRVVSLEQFDRSFARWVEEAYEVGAGSHRQP